MKLWEFLHSKQAINTRAEYKRMTTQGIVRVNGQIIEPDMFCDCVVEAGDFVEVGKRRKFFVV